MPLWANMMIITITGTKKAATSPSEGFSSRSVLLGLPDSAHSRFRSHRWFLKVLSSCPSLSSVSSLSSPSSPSSHRGSVSKSSGRISWEGGCSSKYISSSPEASLGMICTPISSSSEKAYSFHASSWGLFLFCSFAESSSACFLCVLCSVSGTLSCMGGSGCTSFRTASSSCSTRSISSRSITVTFLYSGLFFFKYPQLAEHIVQDHVDHRRCELTEQLIYKSPVSPQSDHDHHKDPCDHA